MEYVIGVDFGTLSARAVLVTREGAVIRTAAMDYPHGEIFTESEGVRQVPQDYLAALQHTVREVAKGCEERIRGIGVDFTSCTVLPVDASFQPVGLARLWKSHSGAEQAKRITGVCRELGIDLSEQGGSVSSEMMLPKWLELKEKEPEVYEKTAYFVEAGDWIAWMLTGNAVRSTCMAGFKGMWRGDWPVQLLQRLGLEPGMLRGDLRCVGDQAGVLSSWGAEFLGLPQGVPVAVSIIDAHAAILAAGCGPDEIMLSLGTSGAYILLSETSAKVKGVFGKVMNGVLPGYYAYETGQASLGDTFRWFMENCVPHSYYEKSGGNLFSYMEGLAAEVRENPVWAIDWWNGSRTPYADVHLTGSIFGLTLRTKPEQIYRALLESAAFGIRQIIEEHEKAGLKVKKVHTGGGIGRKNKLFMQILADVLGRELTVSDREPAGAIGAAVLAACSAGLYADPEAAAAAMAAPPAAVYQPNPAADYEEAYGRYVRTADHMAEM